MPNLKVKLAGNLFAHEKMFFGTNAVIEFVRNSFPTGQALFM